MVAPRVAVIGGGVSACSLVHGLRDHFHLTSQHVSLTVFEMGRSCGGRAATRISRDLPALRVNHGAPSFSARTKRFEELCDKLVARNALARCDTAAFKHGTLTRDGRFMPEDLSSAPPRYTSSEGLGMSAFCESLLSAQEVSSTTKDSFLQTVFGTMVSKIDPIDDGWRLFSRSGEPLGDFDWLVVTSTGLAHPRWRDTFGGEPPLVEAAKMRADPSLDAALAALAPLTSKPVTAALVAFESEAAMAWASLPFSKLRLEGDATLSRVVVQRLSPSLTAVVLHSTHEFARECASVYGATSAAARLAGAKSDAGTETRILEAMLAVAQEKLSSLADRGTLPLQSPKWGPHLHRWGAAFPDQPLLPTAQANVPSAKVTFCGDFVDTEHNRAASVEGAALSGLDTAEMLVEALQLNSSCKF